MANLIVTMGIPWSGKSTWVRTMLGHGKYSIVSSDDIRRERWGSLRKSHDVDSEEKKRRSSILWDTFYRQVEEQLKHNVDTVADATNLMPRARSRLRDIAERTKSDLHIVVFDNCMQALERNVQRDYDLVVPDDVQQKFLVDYASAFLKVLGDESTWYDSVTVIGALP